MPLLDDTAPAAAGGQPGEAPPPAGVPPGQEPTPAGYQPGEGVPEQTMPGPSNQLLTSPTDWPKGASTTKLDNTWPSHLWRCMHGNHDDLVPVEGVPNTVDDSVELARLASRAIRTGCTNPSPFLHLSKDFKVARHWYMRYRNEWGDMRCYMVRVRTASLPRNVVIDMSTVQAQHTFLGPNAHDNVVQENLAGMKMALAHKEVVLLRRGTVPWSILERCDPDDGHPLGTPLQDRCSRVPWSHGRDAIGRSSVAPSSPSLRAGGIQPARHPGRSGVGWRGSPDHPRGRAARARKHEAARRTPG